MSGETDSAWVRCPLGSIATDRGCDVIDLLLDVVLLDNFAPYLVLLSLAPSLGWSDEGRVARVAVWKDPRVMPGDSDAGDHLDLMCQANYPTRVLGEMVRRRSPLSVEEAVATLTDRFATTASATAAGSSQGGTPILWCSTPTPWTVARPGWSTTWLAAAPDWRPTPRVSTTCWWPESMW